MDLDQVGKLTAADVMTTPALACSRGGVLRGGRRAPRIARRLGVARGRRQRPGRRSHFRTRSSARSGQPARATGAPAVAQCGSDPIGRGLAAGGAQDQGPHDFSSRSGIVRRADLGDRSCDGRRPHQPDPDRGRWSPGGHGHAPRSTSGDLEPGAVDHPHPGKPDHPRLGRPGRTVRAPPQQPVIAAHASAAAEADTLGAPPS